MLNAIEKPYTWPDCIKKKLSILILIKFVQFPLQKYYPCIISEKIAILKIPNVTIQYHAA